MITLNGREVDESTLAIDGVDPTDYPDLCDSYFAEGFYVDGLELNDLELEQITSEQPELLYEMAMESLR